MNFLSAAFDPTAPAPSGAEAATSLRQIIAPIAGLRGIVAMSLGGSTGADLADDRSDLDIHVYWRAPLAEPTARAEQLARIADPGSISVDIRSWGLEDHFELGGRGVELIYVELDELREHIDQAYSHGLNTESYTTTRLYYVAHGHPLYDSTGELSELHQRLLAGYPEPTRRLLLQHLPELLRVYTAHVRLAQSRGDLLSVQHRRYTVQMVFFNLLFALNRRYHPGEKRLLIHAERCPIRPQGCAERWARSARLAADDPALAEELEGLVEELCDLAAQQDTLATP